MLKARTFLTSALVLTGIAASAQQYSSSDWLNHIKSGRTVQVTFDLPFDANGTFQPLGDIRLGDTYKLSYKQGAFTVTGYHLGSKKVRTMTYTNADITQSRISFWGRHLLVGGNGTLIDFTYGKVATLKTDSAIRERIREGHTFKVTFDLCKFDDSGNIANDPMGDLLAGETYVGNYDKSANSFTLTGFHEGANGNETMTYTNANLDQDKVSLWGRTYRFDEFGFVYDSDFGLVGHLVFPGMTGQPSNGSSKEVSVSEHAAENMN